MAFTSFLYGTTLFYPSNGTYTWTCPPGVTFVNVECWGAGGGGGGTSSTSAAGGGGGAYAIKANIPVVPGTTYTVTVGLGAAGSTGSASGGGSSWFSTTGTVLAVGGNGGTALGVAGAGGAAGSCVGDLAFSGGSGLGSGGSAGGGGAAGTTANGTTATTVAGGAGGVFGGGAGGSGLSPSAGQIPGGGGGSSITLVGAAGADGQLNLNYVLPLIGGTTTPSTAATDNSTKLVKLTSRREWVTETRSVKQHGLADEASYFIATNPTPGTGIVFAVQTTLSDTKPYVVITNPDASGVRLYLAHFDFTATVANSTAAASFRWAVKVDTLERVAATGGSTIVPVNVNMQTCLKSACFVQVGSLTVGAVTKNVRLLGSGLFQPGESTSKIPIIGSQYQLLFGGKNNILNSLPANAAASTTPTNVVENTTPVIIGPGQMALIYFWFPGGSGSPSFEFELGWYER